MNSTAANTIADIKNYGQANNIPIILDDGLTFIIDFIKTHKIKKILEIGTAIGYSAINFAAVAGDIYVDTIEYDTDRYNIAVKNIASMGLSDRIRAFHADAMTIDSTLLDNDYDMIFLDGPKAQYKNMFCRFAPLLSPFGFIIADNINFHGMVWHKQKLNYSTTKLVNKIRHFIAFLKGSRTFETTFYQIGDGIAVSVHSKNPADINNDKLQSYFDLMTFHTKQILLKPITMNELFDLYDLTKNSYYNTADTVFNKCRTFDDIESYINNSVSQWIGFSDNQPTDILVYEIFYQNKFIGLVEMLYCPNDTLKLSYIFDKAFRSYRCQIKTLSTLIHKFRFFNVRQFQIYFDVIDEEALLCSSKLRFDCSDDSHCFILSNIQKDQL